MERERQHNVNGGRITATQPPVPIAASIWRRQGIRPGREGEYIHTGKQIQLGRMFDYSLLVEWDVRGNPPVE